MKAALSKAGVEVIVALPDGPKVAVAARKKSARSEQPFTAPEPLPVLEENAEEKDVFLD
jgi:hypothetical protein